MKRLLLLCFFFLTTTSYAEKISAFNVDITVEQSGELLIVESIEYDFEQASKHGMFRDIPFTIKRAGRLKDLGLYDFSVQLDDGIVAWQKSTFMSTKSGEVTRLKIGSPHTYVTGKHLYKISYRVKMGVLPSAQNENKDAIRWNIIGTGWKIPIENVIANFYLPSSLHNYDISLSSYTGLYGAKNSRLHTEWITPQHLRVSVKSLKPYEGATVEMAFEADTLDQNGLDNMKSTLLEWFLGVWHWGALAGFLLYFRYVLQKYTGFIDRRSIAVRYYPPKDMSVLEAGLVLDKFADIKDFSAAVLELAEHGYIEIYQENKKDDPLLKRTSKSTESLGMDQKYLLDHVFFKGSSQSYTLSKGTESKAKSLQSGFKQINDNLYKFV